MEGDPKRNTVALCITGSIAAFKAVEVARALLESGVRVLPVMTRSACRFVGPTTFTALCGEVARADMWDPAVPGELHIQLATQADAIVVAPATADAIARFACGRSDDLLGAVVLCARGPVLIAPAMHPRMWAHPATQRNVATLRADGRVSFVGPVVGPVATGEVGLGRMAEPDVIVSSALSLLGSRDLQGRHIVVTAGPTVEDIDPVRFLGNRSTGRMGFAVARRAAARGARVTLVCGPTGLATPPEVTRVDVRSTQSMRDAVWQVFGSDLSGADALVMAAAVADYRPAEVQPTKQKRGHDALVMELRPNPDLLAEIGNARRGTRPVLIGFAVETETGNNLVACASEKLARKRVDAIVANAASDAFGSETNRAVWVTPSGAEQLAEMSKLALADRILDAIRDRLVGSPR